LILGIESTAHTISIGIVNKDADVLFLKSMRVDPPNGGIYPTEAAEEHCSNAIKILEEIKLKIDLKSITQVSYAMGPGLPNCLRVGATLARSISQSLKIPLVPVNHCKAHIEIAHKTSKLKESEVIAMYASGGNTQIILCDFEKLRYTILSETIDIGIGNMLDKFGRHCGLPFYAGPIIEKKAKNATTLHTLPKCIKGNNFIFSGCLTAAKSLYDKFPEDFDNICYSIQYSSFSALQENLTKILNQKSLPVYLVGGVACNDLLSNIIKETCDAYSVPYWRPPKHLAVDNGAMIAWSGNIHKAEKVDILKSKINPYLLYD